MFDDLKGLKKQFKMNRRIERQRLFSYMDSHGYTRLRSIKKRVPYLLEAEEVLDIPSEFLTRYDLVRGMVEGYSLIYAEEYTNWVEDDVIVILGKELADGTGICDIIKIECKPNVRSSTLSIDTDGSVWFTSSQSNVRNISLNCNSLDIFEIDSSYRSTTFNMEFGQIWRTTNDYISCDD